MPLCALTIITMSIGQATSMPAVSISGGPDASGHLYAWTIRNTGPSPIVYVAVPHHRGDLCLPPPGWSAEMTTDACLFRAPSPADGIPRRGQAEFRLRVGPAGARRGHGEVRIRFDNGEEQRMPDVLVPVREPAGDHYVPLVGLGVIFIALVVHRVLSQRKGKTTEAKKHNAPSASSHLE
ncbi:MAG: hypothetical protein ACE5EX_06495 [Phycisphaerae bacterium]